MNELLELVKTYPGVWITVGCMIVIVILDKINSRD